MVNWMPSLNATYVFSATVGGYNCIDNDGNGIGDTDFPYTLSTPVSNIAIWNGTSVSMVPHAITWGEYFADQNGDGKVDYIDLGYITGKNYGLKNLSPSWKNLLPKPPP